MAGVTVMPNLSSLKARFDQNPSVNPLMIKFKKFSEKAVIGVSVKSVIFSLESHLHNYMYI